MDVTVSIITPSFNQAQFIEDTIRSVIGQTYPHVEHIVMDGGSTDGTLDILQRYEPQVRWLSEPDNGQGDAVNKGFALARGDIVAWINSDDFYFSPTVFEHVATLFAKYPEVDMVFGGIAYVDEKGKLLQVRVPPGFDYHRMQRIPYVQNSNTFLRRTVIEHHKIDINLHYLLDTEFFVRVAKEHKGLSTRQVLTCFRIHNDQKTQTLSSKAKAEERKRRNEIHSIRVDTRFRLLQLLDRMWYKYLSLEGGGRIRRQWRGNLPYQRFLTDSTWNHPLSVESNNLNQTMLFAFSGIDGAGKSTQIAKFSAILEAQGHKPVCVWSRGGYTSFLDSFKLLLRKMAGGKAPPPGESQQRQTLMQRSLVRRLWLIIAILDLIRLYAAQIRVWLLLGRPVICDRYLWDTQIDFHLNFPQERVTNCLLWRLLELLAPKPDVSYLLMLPLEESIRRCTLKDDPFPAPYEVQVRRFALYQELTANGGFEAIDATQGVDEVFADILAAVDSIHKP